MGRSYNSAGMHFDFDAWIYGVDTGEPQRVSESLPMSNCTLVADDVKFAFNAWALLRLSFFFGCRSNPQVLTKLSRTTPNMQVAARGNRLFHMLADIGKEKLDPNAVKIGLMASPTARSIDHFDFLRCQPVAHPDLLSPGNTPAAQEVLTQPEKKRIQLVVGMENGMSDECLRQCDHCVYIPQYGSIGSLSMMTALGIAVHQCHTWNVGKPDGRLRWRRNDTGGSSSEEVPGSLSETLDPVAETCSSVPLPSTATQLAAKQQPKPRPHCDALMGLSNPEVMQFLQEQRQSFKFQIGLIWQNDIADRNIGACMRNANAFNCEKMILLNRRKFNSRGSVGTHHYMPMPHFRSFDAPECQSGFDAEVDGYALWEIHQFYPYLQHHLDGVNSAPATYPLVVHDKSITPFIRPTDTGVSTALPPPLEMSPVCLDDDACLLEAVRDVVETRKLRGIMLVVPDEGSTLRPKLRQRCERTVFVVNPFRSEGQSQLQRGLHAQVSTGIAFERLRWAMRALS